MNKKGSVMKKECSWVKQFIHELNWKRNKSTVDVAQVAGYGVHVNVMKQFVSQQKFLLIATIYFL